MNEGICNVCGGTGTIGKTTCPICDGKKGNFPKIHKHSWKPMFREVCSLCNGTGKGIDYWNDSQNKWERNLTDSCDYCLGDGVNYFIFCETSCGVEKAITNKEEWDEALNYDYLFEET